jgi:hypothetical protein
MDRCCFVAQAVYLSQFSEIQVNPAHAIDCLKQSMDGEADLPESTWQE